MDIKEKISRTLEHWFIGEPALFQILCSHDIQENRAMQCPVRSGRRRLEYNPDFLEGMSDRAIEEILKVEAIRILLKHPYERKPDLCSDQASAIGSNITVGDNYFFRDNDIDTPKKYDLQTNMPYEWYARQIQMMLPPSSSSEDGSSGASDTGSKSRQPGSDGNGQNKYQETFENEARKNRDLSELWDEDEMTVAMINGIIDKTTEWGSLSGGLLEKIQASTKAKINWRSVFSGFRASIIRSSRKLTRMRPSRRSGFEQMGSTREFTTKLLIAIDVSGSITSEALERFFGVVNSAFKYGIEHLDVVEFDCGITAKYSMKKRQKESFAVGRGGTSFQEPIDYAHENGYDGILILTDGYAPEPELPDFFRTKILWVCEDDDCFRTHNEWMKKYGRVTTVMLG